MDTITIRTLAERDKPAWRPLFDGYLAFYKTSLEGDVIEATWSRLISEDPNFAGLVAVCEDDVPVGLAHYIIHATTWTKEPTCYLQDLFVDPALRGKGVGRRLITELRGVAEQQGCGRLYWLTEECNYKGRMLYDTVAKKTPFIVYEDRLKR